MAKSPAKKNVPVATATDGAEEFAQPASTTEHDIARRAYDLYLARGAENGHDVDDWLQAERELQVDAQY